MISGGSNGGFFCFTDIFLGAGLIPAGLFLLSVGSVAGILGAFFIILGLLAFISGLIAIHLDVGLQFDLVAGATFVAVLATTLGASAFLFPLFAGYLGFSALATSQGALIVATIIDVVAGWYSAYYSLP